jgi:hypothetical protein
MRLIDANRLITVMKSHKDNVFFQNEIVDLIKKQPTVQQWHWTPVSRTLPDKLIPVLITYVNRNPASYYQDIKDKPDVAAAYYCNKKWWWFSSVCEDYLSEYGQSPLDEIDEGIEVIAWMELPKPYKEEQ